MPELPGRRLRFLIICLGGYTIPGLFPPSISLQIDSAGFGEGKQEAFTGERLSLQYFTESATPQPDPFDACSWQQPGRMLGAVLKQPERWPVGPQMKLSQAS